MIPSIEQILQDYRQGKTTLIQAVNLIEQHCELARQVVNEGDLLDMFAVGALQGMVAGSQGLAITTEQFAEQSYNLAQAMMDERLKVRG